jgi:D-sedoheptulose 7-phosphate isomerase
MPMNDTKESFAVRRRLLAWLEEQVAGDVRTIAEALTRCLAGGGTVFACGNGGSASQAEHFVAELSGRFRRERRALSAQALSANSSAVTAIANDYGFAEVFSRQLDGCARSVDCLLVLSTSGHSENVINACHTGRENGVRVFALTGETGGALASLAEVTLKVPDTDTARIQEVHLAALHVICQQVEENVFAPSPSRTDNG